MTDPLAAGSGHLAFKTDGHRLAIVGEVRTAEERQGLRNAVDAILAHFPAGESELILDLASALYLDTATLTTLLSLARRCNDHGKTLALEHANAETLQQLQATHLDQVLARYGTRIAA